MTEEAISRVIVGVGVIVRDKDRVLLIKRGKPPRRGEWSIPGGRQKFGETVRAGALRELKEETGIDGEILGLVDVVDASHRLGATEVQLTLVDFAARMIGGKLKAGDDAAEARWFAEDQLNSLGLWRETLRVIRKAKTLYP